MARICLFAWPLFFLCHSQAQQQEIMDDSIITTSGGRLMPVELVSNPFNEYLGSGSDTETAPPSNSNSVSPCSRCGAPGSVGPMLIIYLTYNGQTPVKTLDQVRTALFGTPGYADMLAFASWGQTILTQADVDYFEMESEVDPDTWGVKPSLGTVKNEITSQNIYKNWKSNHRSYELELMILPGATFQATAYMPGSFSRYRGNSITWQTIAHEVGHNWGIGHAGGYYSGQRFEQYADDALMGYQRERRAGDFTAVARFNLGWIKADQIAGFPAQSHAEIRALNEGFKPDGKKLLMTIPCTTCKSNGGQAGGNLYVSFRVSDSSHRYGVELDNHLRDKVSSESLVLVDRVHVHFQSNGGRSTELWSTIGEGSTFTVPGANIWIHVCFVELKPQASTEYATVKASATSMSDAENGCRATATVTTTATKTTTATTTTTTTTLTTTVTTTTTTTATTTLTTTTTRTTTATSTMTATATTTTTPTTTTTTTTTPTTTTTTTATTTPTTTTTTTTTATATTATTTAAVTTTTTTTTAPTAKTTTTATTIATTTATTTTPPTATTTTTTYAACFTRGCGCPGNFGQSWCTESTGKVQSDWCQGGSARCENQCNGRWCRGPAPNPTPAPTGTCYIAQCGCPGSYALDWCSDATAQMQSTECRTSENLCTSICKGKWCPGSRRLELERNASAAIWV